MMNSKAQPGKSSPEAEQNRNRSNFWPLFGMTNYWEPATQSSETWQIQEQEQEQARPQYFCVFCSTPFRVLEDYQLHTLTEHPEKHEVETSGPMIAFSNLDKTHCVTAQISMDLASEEALRQIPPSLGSFSYDIAPVNSPERTLGTFKGVQGENNSCYLDSSLMAMFYSNETFDSLLSSNGATAAVSINEETLYCKTFLTRHVINNLRQRGFVEASFVTEWRRMIEPYFRGGVDFSGNCERQEACDFVRFIIGVFGTHGNRSLSFGIGTARDESMSEVMVQLLPPPNSEHLTLSADKLLRYFQETQGLSFRDIGNSLILQLPRNGSKHRPVGAFLPDPVLWVDHYSSLRSDGDQETNGDIQEKLCFELRAVIVIGTGHFVTYMRVRDDDGRRIPRNDSDGSRGRIRWLYADSMSDRQFGRNVPIVEDVTEELEELECPNAVHRLFSDRHTGRYGTASSSPHSHLQRITRDASMLFYSRVCDSRPHNCKTEEVFICGGGPPAGGGGGKRGPCGGGRGGDLNPAGSGVPAGRGGGNPGGRGGPTGGGRGDGGRGPISEIWGYYHTRCGFSARVATILETREKLDSVEAVGRLEVADIKRICNSISKFTIEIGFDSEQKLIRMNNAIRWRACYGYTTKLHDLSEDELEHWRLHKIDVDY